MRIRIFVLVIAVLLFAAVITVPQIIEAKRSGRRRDARNHHSRPGAKTASDSR